MSRTTSSVFAHVQAEREMQKERWGWRGDATRSDADWNRLIRSYLTQAGASRYVRLVQVAALAVAAAEREMEVGDAIIARQDKSDMPAASVLSAEKSGPIVTSPENR